MKYFLIILLFYHSLQKSKVYFTKDITSSNMVKMFKLLNVTLSGNIGLKVHSGEIGGKYFLSPNFLQEIYDYTNGTFIECNTAYKGGRHSTELHRELLFNHSWLDNDRRFVIMDENPDDDFNLTVDDPLVISENIVGAHLNEFNSCIVLSHLKGHQMGGFGGALKQLSIGFGSQKGKTWIHTGGKTTDWTQMFNKTADQITFTNAMGDAASSIVKYFRERGGIVFLNVMSNISLYCDCAGGNAPAPKIHDMGILASTDPVAIDKACLDLIKNHLDIGTDEFLDQIKRLEGENTIAAAEKHKIGIQDYELIDIDPDEPDNSGSALLIIIIICSVVAILIIGGIVAIVIYKKRQEPRESTGKISLINRSTEKME